MEDFVFELDEAEAVKAGKGGASFGTLDTGVYDVRVAHAVKGKTKKGNNKLDLSIEILDDKGEVTHNTTIYQAFVMDKTWVSGKENFGYKDFQAFAVVSGMKSFTLFKKPLLKEDGSPVQKDGEDIVLDAVKELEGIKLKLAIVKVFDVHNGKTTEENEVFASFTKEGKNANEKTNDLEPVALGKLETRLSDKKTNNFKKFIAEESPSSEDSSNEDSSREEDLGL